MTRDVLELVAEHDLGALAPVATTVTYQDSCHLAHAQRITSAPRTILKAIPSLDLRELASPDRCCGSAGIYAMVQRDMSRRLLDEKMDDIGRTGASTVATANPGCMMQIEGGFALRGRAGRVVHVIELLDEAMGGPRGGS
jgi:glycolate oxidase iron-sulfur subunit